MSTGVTDTLVTTIGGWSRRGRLLGDEDESVDDIDGERWRLLLGVININDI